MRKINFIIAIVVSLTSCLEIQQSDNALQKQEVDQFEILMTDLIRLYPKLPTTNADTIEYKETYQLRKKIYYPNIYSGTGATLDLTLELRQNTPCGGCWDYQVIYAYNDSLNFVLPLTDYYFFWKMSGDKTLTQNKFEENLSFQTEFNKLLHRINPSTRYEVQKIVDAVMIDMLNFYPATKFDVPKLKEIAQHIHTDNFYNDSCRNKIISNVTRTESELTNRDKLIYTNGILIHLVEINKTENDSFECKIETLNNECYAMLIF